MEYKEKSPAPLDNDALTRLIYLHDDEITQLFVRIRQLEEELRTEAEFLSIAVENEGMAAFDSLPAEAERDA